MGDALKLAEQLANGPSSLAVTRSLYWQSPLNTYEEQLDLERACQERAGKTEDFMEGVSAFLQKRQAKFKGK
jgi:2-(1,2-epoxy-1,2-dihydrophenyl)acetyl-CoA isomerase